MKNSGLWLSVFVFCIFFSSIAFAATFTEDFEDTVFRDPATTAVWDTNAEEARLPESLPITPLIEQGTSAIDASLGVIWIFGGICPAGGGCSPAGNLNTIYEYNIQNKTLNPIGVRVAAFGKWPAAIDQANHKAYVFSGTTLQIINIITQKEIQRITLNKAVSDGTGPIGGTAVFNPATQKIYIIDWKWRVISSTVKGHALYEYDTTIPGNNNLVRKLRVDHPMSVPVMVISPTETIYLVSDSLVSYDSNTNNYSVLFSNDFDAQESAAVWNNSSMQALLTFGSNGCGSACDSITKFVPPNTHTTEPYALPEARRLATAQYYATSDNSYVFGGLNNLSQATDTIYACNTSACQRVSHGFPGTYIPSAVVQSLQANNASDPDISSVRLQAVEQLNGQTVIYSVSRNGGTNWHTVSSGVTIDLTPFSSESPKNDLRWRAELSTGNSGVTPKLKRISLSYNFAGGASPPTLSANIECLNGGWSPCPNQAGSNSIRQVRATCTDPEPNISNVRFVLRNPLGATVFDAVNSSVQGNYYIYDNDPDVVRNIPGYWEITATCTDSTGFSDTESNYWFVRPVSSPQISDFKCSIDNGATMISCNFIYFNEIITNVSAKCVDPLNDDIESVNFTLNNPYGVQVFSGTVTDDNGSDYYFLDNDPDAVLDIESVWPLQAVCTDRSGDTVPSNLNLNPRKTQGDVVQVLDLTVVPSVTDINSTITVTARVKNVSFFQGGITVNVTFKERNGALAEKTRAGVFIPYGEIDPKSIFVTYTLDNPAESSVQENNSYLMEVFVTELSGRERQTSNNYASAVFSVVSRVRSVQVSELSLEFVPLILIAVMIVFLLEKRKAKK